MTQFDSLRWHRLRLTLRNTRLSRHAIEHPLAIVQAIVKAITIEAWHNWDTCKNNPIFHIRGMNHTHRLRAGDRLDIDVFFFGRDTEAVTVWRRLLIEYFGTPGVDRNYRIEAIGEVEERDYATLLRETGLVPAAGELCLEFLTPVSFKPPKDKSNTYMDADDFVRLMENRFSRLFDTRITYQRGDDDLRLLPYYWSYTQINHHSKSMPGEKQLLKGCFGKLYIRGSFANLLPFIILGQELHAGTGYMSGLGYYELHCSGAPGYFERFFPSEKMILSVIRDVMQRYDNAAAAPAVSGETLPPDEERIAARIAEQIRDDTYTPSPNTAFVIKKNDGDERMVEQPGFYDLVMQQYLLKTLSDKFDRMFEVSSIGYRKGVSREKAVEMIHGAIADGYRYMVESDIEDFFPSVDLSILWRLIDEQLPLGDTTVRNLLRKVIHTGYIRSGQYHTRSRGLAQGSPLSPLLANLYLDVFDEYFREVDARLIRYADDFIILTRSESAARQALSGAQECLRELGLSLNKDKTAIRPVEEGFQFLGIRFDNTGVEMNSEDNLKLLRKPLYITEPYLFVGINGEAVEIRRYNEIVEVIPLRRLSEIVILGNASMSTSLIRKCTDYKIPLTITLESGYYVATVKPDDRSYHEVTYLHGRRYHALSEGELISHTREILRGKLAGYISLFEQRRDYPLVRELENAVIRSAEAGDPDTVRGIEGHAARLVYEHLNLLISNEYFHIRKRERKKPDPINSLLNFGYYLAFSRINATIRAHGLNPYLGFLHSPFNEYESLAYDILELYRARIDRLIIRMINLEVIKKGDLHESDKGGFYLTRDGIRKYVNQYEKEMETKHPGESISLKDSIYTQSLIIKNWAANEKSLTFYRWER